MSLINEEFIKYGQNNYVEFHTGNMNLLISVPHDGSLKPEEISSRKNDVLNNYKRDLNTRIIAIELCNILKSLFKNEEKSPFMVFNNLHRIKMDPNRDPQSCCELNTEPGYIAYHEYHDFIANDFEKNFVKANNFSNGLLIDLHGHNHPEKMIELGYFLSLNCLNTNHVIESRNKNCSLSRLAETSNHSLEELIRGKVSFGNILETNLSDKVNVLPSLKHRFPLNHNYYSGGYIIQKYGSKCVYNQRKPSISAIQIELPQFIRLEANYLNYTTAIAYSIYEFYNIHNFNNKKF